MKVHLIYDLAQYDFVLIPVEEELKRRGHTVTKSKVRPGNVKADCSVMIQDVGVAGAPRPRFFINHGASCIKGWGLNSDVDVFLAQTEYWAKGVEKRWKKTNHRGTVLLTNGWPKMDVLYKLKDKRKEIRDELSKKFKFDKSKPLIVYYPTYYAKRIGKEWNRNNNFSDVVKQLKDYNVFVFPHQMDKSYDHCKNVLRVFGMLRQKFLAASDLLISDRSGTVFEYTIFDKPIVLLGNVKNEGFFKVEHNKELVDVGPMVDISGLRKAVIESLNDPNRYASRRKYWMERVVGPCDGKHSKRVVDVVEAYMNGDYEKYLIYERG